MTMGKRKPTIPTFVYFLVRDFDGTPKWGHCPVLSLEGEMLVY
jgi:hypothetical protein